MTDLAKLKAANQVRWTHCNVLSEWLRVLDSVAHRLINAKSRYESVRTASGVPWQVVAVIHQRESAQSWLASLAQGDPWSRPSIHQPHRPAFSSWEAAAEDALEVCPPHAAQWGDWSIGGALTLLEQYNGLGYANLNRPSPYIWSATNEYLSGKYTSDGHYDPHAIDQQAGCAALLIRMTIIDPTIAQEWHP